MGHRSTGHLEMRKMMAPTVVEDHAGTDMPGRHCIVRGIPHDDSSRRVYAESLKMLLHVLRLQTSRLPAQPVNQGESPGNTQVPNDLFQPALR